MRFQVLTAASMKMTALRDITPSSLIEVNRRFRGAYCLHHHRLDGGSTHLLNAGLNQRDYTALYHKS
jgi:hypothetical protein